MDPYAVLGVAPGSSLNTVKNAYKKLVIQTHPDKGGNITLYKLVSKAYKEIERSHKHSKQWNDAPKQKMTYSGDVEIQPKRPVSGKKFNQTQFNTFFTKNRIDDHNPYSQSGYKNFMCNSLQVAEDIDVMKKQKIRGRERQVVLYKEPQPINELYTDSYSLLGVKNVSDFSCSNGTDYLKAYTDPEEQIDTVRRYKNVDALLNDRSSQNFTKSREEEEYFNQLEKQRRKMEQVRISNMMNTERDISEKYTHLNRRLK